jgi:hypothetical protein
MLLLIPVPPSAAGLWSHDAQERVPSAPHVHIMHAPPTEAFWQAGAPA